MNTSTKVINLCLSMDVNLLASCILIVVYHAAIVFSHYFRFRNFRVVRKSDSE
jgi:hypothetical protein